MSASFSLGQAIVPAAAGGMPGLTFPMATLVFFQFVFAAITVIILAGSVLGRMSFRAWAIFCPVWMTLVYTVGAFSLWGGGWLGGLGIADFSGGYVIHLAAAASGFTAAAVVGPRLQADRDHFPPNSRLTTLVGAASSGWVGTVSTAATRTSRMRCRRSGHEHQHCHRGSAAGLDAAGQDAYGKPSIIGAVNGMIAGLVAITPAAGYVDGWGALIIGVAAGIIPWLSMNKFAKTKLMMKVDDTLGVSQRTVLLVCWAAADSVLANPAMLEYIGTDKEAPGVSITAGSTVIPIRYSFRLKRWLHHRLQRDCHVHHPQDHLVHHAAAYG